MTERSISAVIERDAFVERVVGVLEREDPGGQPTIVAAAVADALWPDIERAEAECVELRKIIAIQDQALRDVNIASGRSDETIRVKVGSTILAANGMLSMLDNRRL